MKVEEITVAEAFDRCYPSNFRKERLNKDKTVVCAQCGKELAKIIAINDRIGVCPCGEVIFDWRSPLEIRTPLYIVDQALLDVIKTYGGKRDEEL